MASQQWYTTQPIRLFVCVKIWSGHLLRTKSNPFSTGASIFFHFFSSSYYEGMGLPQTSAEEIKIKKKTTTNKRATQQQQYKRRRATQDEKTEQ